MSKRRRRQKRRYKGPAGLGQGHGMLGWLGQVVFTMYERIQTTSKIIVNINVETQSTSLETSLQGPRRVRVGPRHVRLVRLGRFYHVGKNSNNVKNNSKYQHQNQNLTLITSINFDVNIYEFSTLIFSTLLPHLGRIRVGLTRLTRPVFSPLPLYSSE